MRSPKLALSLFLAATAIGGCAVLTDRRATEREQSAEAAFPPTGQLLRVAGTTVHAHVQGSGPDLVLIHGASGSTRDFTFALVDRLAQDYRVIAFDRPGLGWTEDLGDGGVSPLLQARLLQAAADQLGVTRPIVMGHSYGGSVAMAWGLTDTADVAALETALSRLPPHHAKETVVGWKALARAGEVEVLAAALRAHHVADPDCPDSVARIAQCNPPAQLLRRLERAGSLSPRGVLLSNDVLQEFL
jgi:pimeloyl-ACP methyl ester carboxylesterase